jgi:hypothetical protein
LAQATYITLTAKASTVGINNHMSTKYNKFTPAVISEAEFADYIDQQIAYECSFDTAEMVCHFESSTSYLRSYK